MKKHFLAIALTIFCLRAMAQSADVPQSTEMGGITRLEAGLQGVDLGYEVPLSCKWAVNLSAGFGGGYCIDNPGYANVMANWTNTVVKN